MGMPGQMPGQMGMGGQMPGQMGVPQQQAPAPAPAAPAAQAPPEKEKVDIMDIPWAIPLQQRAGYMAQFQANDKARTGHLAAVQARNLLLQTGLAQQTLAGVWNLADIDKDGKLNTEEFCLAMHLCEVAMKGEPLPAQLPVSLVPPSMRRAAKDAGVIGPPGSQSSGVQSPASFEDKRKDNWEKGQEELNRRRASLLEQQQQEKAERLRKEKEAAEEREKKKREVEAKKAAELEARRAREVEL